MSLADDYTIEPISQQQANEIVISNHYLHRRAPCSKAFGLFKNGEMECYGVVMYGVSPSSTLLKGIAGEDEAQNIYELTRLWVSDKVPKNGESFLIGNTLRLLDKEIIVSFADTGQEHLGIVYQATNFLYTGLSAKFRDPKVVGLEHQHHATYAHGLNKQQLIEKFGEENVYYIDRSRKHRYIFINAAKNRRKVLMKKLRYEILPYPKKVENVD